MRERLDAGDRKLVKWLSIRGEWSMSELAERVGVSIPTLRGRMRRLFAQQLIKITGMVNIAERPELISAIVGINAQGHGRAREIADRISQLPFVCSASVVTGRFDIIAEVVVAGDVADLYRITSELIPSVGEPGEIMRSETFVIMAPCNKWVNLPDGVWQADIEDEPVGKHGS